jgi:hypothetical protein
MYAFTQLLGDIVRCNEVLLQTWPASPASENVVTKSQLRTSRTPQTSVIDRRLTLPNGDRRSVPGSMFGITRQGKP